MIFFKKKRVELGDGFIIQYTIFENKFFGGIWIYNWKTILQNRFHTHAFSAYAFLLSGSYTEEVIQDGKILTRVVSQWMRPRRLPKNYCHRILRAEPNTWTIVFFGKWEPNWWEYFNDTKTWIQYAWGRKMVKKISGDETTKLK
jgi:hypothetical protein|tara:strand:+ start:3051 stop:3482 length:432 start_codon:yes stop_codon:yes gene_type:complete